MRGAAGQTYEDWIGSDSWKAGQSSEDSFGAILRGKYPEARKATLQEQYEHKDWVCSAGSIDVKALKSRNRGASKQEDYIWIEFRNNVGDAGWLYGTQDFVAFEGHEDYIVVRTEDLRRACELLCYIDKRVDRASDALYKGYSRKNRSDLISMIRRSDLLNINHKALKKTCRTSTNTTAGTRSSSMT
jgi:hypothetical protein